MDPRAPQPTDHLREDSLAERGCGLQWTWVSGVSDCREKGKRVNNTGDMVRPGDS